MKYFRFLPLLLWQCVPQQDDYDKFVKLKQADDKHLVCTIYSVDDDTDLSHYEISGVALQGNVEKGILKVASGRKGRNYQYDIPLEPNKNVRLSDICTSTQGFKNGKSCQFRLLFDDTAVAPRFILKNGKLQCYNKDEKLEVKDDGKIVMSIFVKHRDDGKEQKTSAEMSVNK